MTRAGHSSYATTRRYIDLAGARLGDDANRLERRLWGESSTKSRYQKADQRDAVPVEAQENPHE
jgi:hypothetical protein